ncbi:hypothetical protein MKX03_014946 [Papaver bracteatum]|nr:hypothetical protein MKX03_014946 [Papaver bracteatum]
MAERVYPRSNSPDRLTSENNNKKNTRRNPCRCCFCWILSIIVLLILLTVIAAVAFYFIFKPKVPNYSVENMSIKGFKFEGGSYLLSDQSFSLEFGVTVRAQNPNSRIGIYYDTPFLFPNFYQPRNNVTVFETLLKTPSLQLSEVVRNGLYEEQRKRKIPLGVDIKVPARLKVGSIRTWKFTIRVHCDVIVDKLAEDTKVLSKKCSVDLKFWKN